jgi:ABC-type cobalamin transport system ATPase subunit
MGDQDDDVGHAGCVEWALGFARCRLAPAGRYHNPNASIPASRMPVIVVANPKGGVGKSTLATDLAGALANTGHAVMLGDVDRQQSSRQWQALRPGRLSRIQGWEVEHRFHCRAFLAFCEKDQCMTQA